MSDISFLRLYAWDLGLPLSVPLSDQIRVAVRVEGVSVPKGSLTISWDPVSSAALLDGSKAMELPAGDYKRAFEWSFEPQSPGFVWIEVRATAGSLRRLVQIPVDVT